MSARAGILVTGTEVLSGRVRDRNGPWLAERLAGLGVELAHTLIVGDRAGDVESGLRFMMGEGVDLIVTSGGLGPTADDLTAQVVARVQGRQMMLDEALEARIAEIVRPLAERYRKLDRDAIAAASRKQATIPRGAVVLGPVGTAPGLVVTPAPSARSARRRSDAHAPAGRHRARAGPTIVVLPGPPRELQPMWHAALATEQLREAIAQADVYRHGVLRLFGIPESEIAQTLREAERQGVRLDDLEVTTCLRGGEIEVVTRYERRAADVYETFAGIVAQRHADTLFSRDGSTVDEQVARLLRGERLDAPGGQPTQDAERLDPPDGQPTQDGERLDAPGGRRTQDGNDARAEVSGGRPLTIAVAESCTGGLLAARLTEPPGASAYVLGGIVAYSNDVKTRQAGVDPQLIERHGAVSGEVALALAQGVRERLGSDVGVGVTGIAGPGGATEQKPLGLVWLSVCGPDGDLTRSVRLPGGRPDVRERAVTVAMHMIRRLLAGEADERRSLQPAPQGPV